MFSPSPKATLYYFRLYGFTVLKLPSNNGNIKICCWFDTCFLNPSEKVSKRLHLSALVVENVDVCYNEAAAVETVVVAVMDFDVVADFV